jgi:prepilin-type N-terminal cleavage/methylation domain-containing protein
VAIRPPKHSSQGFTLIEMVVILGIVGIIAGLAVPSLLTLNRPLRDGVSAFKGHLGLIRSKAISSNQAYRIKPLYLTRAEYHNDKTNPQNIPRNFAVEYAANCSITTRGGTNGWKVAPQFDLDLPENVGITDNSITNLPSYTSVSNDLDWSICFDNRGLASLYKAGAISLQMPFIIKDFQGNHRAKIALFDISQVGGVDIYTYDSSNNLIVDPQNPSQPSF